MWYGRKLPAFLDGTFEDVPDVVDEDVNRSDGGLDVVNHGLDFCLVVNVQLGRDNAK